MRADNPDSLWQRVTSSALWARLRSPKAPLVIALSVALVAVMVYMACNLHSCTQSATIADSGSLWRTSGGTTDADLGRILSEIEGAGATDVLVTYDKSGALVGVIVVSEGANDKQVAVRLMRAVQTATGAKLDQIEIFAKNN